MCSVTNIADVKQISFAFSIFMLHFQGIPNSFNSIGTGDFGGLLGISKHVCLQWAL